MYTRNNFQGKCNLCNSLIKERFFRNKYYIYKYIYIYVHIYVYTCAAYNSYKHICYKHYINVHKRIWTKGWLKNTHQMLTSHLTWPNPILNSILKIFRWKTACFSVFIIQFCKKLPVPMVLYVVFLQYNIRMFKGNNKFNYSSSNKVIFTF